MVAGNSTTDAPAFHETAVEREIEQYRSVSATAVLSLILGLAAPLCLVAPLLLAVPLSAVALALVSLVRISRSEGTLAGRGTAIVGLALAIASIGSVAGRSMLRDRLLEQQASDVGLQWLSMLAGGHLEEAYKLTVEGARQPPTPDLAPEATSDEDQVGHDDGSVPEEFAHHALIEAIAAAGPEADFSVDRDVVVAFQAKKYFVRQSFTIRQTPSAEEARRLAVRLTLERSHSSQDDYARWLVGSVECEDFPPWPPKPF